MHRDEQYNVGSLKGEIPRETGSGCFENRAWLSMAAGLLSPDKARSMMGHAGHCVRCRQFLKMAIEDLSDEATQEEEALLDSLGSNSPSWERSMAEKLRKDFHAVPPRERSSRMMILRPPFLVAAAALLLAATGIWMSLRFLRTP